MKHSILFMTASCLVLLGACVRDDLSWKEQLDAQQKQLDEQKRQQEADALRLAELQKTLDGLKKSDTPFSFVLALPPADTVSKGLDFTSTLRVNPSGLAFTKDMIALDYIAGKQFYRVESNATKASYIKSSQYFSLKNFEADKNDGGQVLDFTSTLRINPSGLAFTKDMIALDYIAGKQFYRVEPNATKASYIKNSQYFSLKNFEADKNDGGQVLDGQYLVTLTTKADEAVWDDSRLAFVGAYVDKEGKNQLVSSDPFNMVMMPLPSEGLSPWIYPHASFLIEEKKKDDKGQVTINERFGAVYLPLDGVLFKTKDDTDGRFYTSENLKDVEFVPDEGCEAAVKVDFDLKKRYVYFEPDTTANLAWRAFQDSTGVKRQEVKGSVILKDRWGAYSSYHVTMYWYNTYVFPINIEATVDEIKAGIPMNLTEEVRKLGLDYDVMKDCRRVASFPVHHLFNDLTFEPFDNNKPEEGELILYAPAVPGDKFQTEELRTVTINASEVDALFSPLTVSFKVVINLTIK